MVALLTSLQSTTRSHSRQANGFSAQSLQTWTRFLRFARAIAHIGVLKVLEEERIPVDLIAGTSAGAILGAAYCAGMSAEEMEELTGTSRFRDFARMTLSRYGLYASDRMANFCERVLNIKNFEDLKIPLAVAATDVGTGDPVVFTTGPLADPIARQLRLSGNVSSVNVDGRSLIDGMLAYSVQPHACAKWAPGL